ncbi:unnamed protein product [Rotaria sp. Silwood1]|nr:unnamed protein product [Rotaria sp. Silwood1]
MMTDYADDLQSIKVDQQEHEEDEEEMDELFMNRNNYDEKTDLKEISKFKSFRTTKWNPKESLSYNYGRIYQFSNFRTMIKEIESKQEYNQHKQDHAQSILQKKIFFIDFIVTCCNDRSVNAMVQSYNVYPPNFAVYLIGRSLLSQGQTINTMYNSATKSISSYFIFFIIIIIFKQTHQF